ncbi:MAG: CAAD domain-containing protein [Cyanobacteria bacterium]|nr:CAAD domain-containing protein [Cyanobacteriota bacterium]MDW8200020.1 CAAD domain-containing protein [Cyanobacteriota bacterium SKYGB_h_bin112]
MMESDQKPADYMDPATSEQKVEIVDNVTALTKMPSPDQSGDQVQQIKAKLLEFVSGLQSFVGEFFEEYRQILVLVALLVGGGISLKLLLAVLGAINEVPLLNPIFELIGIGYTVWFVYRYLLRAESRQELGNEINALKHQILGQQTEDS